MYWYYNPFVYTYIVWEHQHKHNWNVILFRMYLRSAHWTKSDAKVYSFVGIRRHTARAIEHSASMQIWLKFVCFVGRCSLQLLELEAIYFSTLFFRSLSRLIFSSLVTWDVYSRARLRQMPLSVPLHCMTSSEKTPRKPNKCASWEGKLFQYLETRQRRTVYGSCPLPLCRSFDHSTTLIMNAIYSFTFTLFTFRQSSMKTFLLAK